MQIEEIYRPPQVDLEIHPQGQGQVWRQSLSPFFQTSISKMLVLSFFTLGLYQLFWFYEQWLRRKSHGENVSPLLRAIFSPVFVYGLFRGVNHEIEARQAPVQPLGAGLLTLLYLLCSLFGLLPVPISLLQFLGLIPMVIAQKRINELHAAMGFDPREGFSYTAETITAIAVGAAFWGVMFLVAFFAPPT